jgi:hypothetical protein
MNNTSLPRNIDISKITYSDVKVTENGSKSVYVNLDGHSIFMQTPRMYVPFDMSKFNDKSDKAPIEGEREKFTLQVAFKDIEGNPSMRSFFNKIQELDAKFIEDGVENAKSWFKKPYTKEVLAELYSSRISFPKDKDTGEVTDKFPPTFRLSIPVENGKITCSCFSPDKEKLNIGLIKKGSIVTSIIQCSGIWIAGSKFGCSWKVVQMMIAEPVNFKGYSFFDDEDDDGDVLTETAKKFIESSDDDDDVVVEKALNAVEKEDVEDVEDDAVVPDTVAENVAEPVEVVKKPTKKSSKK